LVTSIHGPFVDELQPLVGAATPAGVRQAYTWYSPALAELAAKHATTTATHRASATQRAGTDRDVSRHCNTSSIDKPGISISPS
jgi:hypothetical protein